MSKDILVTLSFWVSSIVAAVAVTLMMPSSIAQPVIFLLSIWLITGFTVVRENERAVKILLGWPYAIAESGLTWVPYFSHNIRRYETGVVELDGFKRAGIITKKGRVAGEDRVYGPANIGADISFRFRWPQADADLIQCVKMLPDPKDKPALTDIFEEQVLDDVRNVGGRKVWVELARDRKVFAQDVSNSLREKATDATGNPTEGNLIVDSRIVEPTVAIAHLDIPENLIAALTVEEEASLRKTGVIISAEAEGEKRRIEGAGTANARRLLLDAIGNDPMDIRKQALLSLEAMAQGTATTIFPIPTDIMQALSGVLSDENVRGASPAALMKMFRLLPKHQKEKILAWVQEELKPKGGV